MALLRAPLFMLRLLAVVLGVFVAIVVVPVVDVFRSLGRAAVRLVRRA
jgi:hypothetical protein